MLDTKRVGAKIASLRKRMGYSQQQIADLLYISPQAVSKWENGHTLPETHLLPQLAQLFSCTIDDILIPEYLVDESDRSLSNSQAQQTIAELGDILSLLHEQTFTKTQITNALNKSIGNIGVCSIKREDSVIIEGNTITKLLVSSSQGSFELIEKKYNGNSAEIRSYDTLSKSIPTLPCVHLIDYDKQLILIDHIDDTYMSGFHYDENNENGVFFRNNLPLWLKAIADWHATFWENEDAFSHIGLDWRLASKENLRSHISMMSKDFKIYKENEKGGKIPKVWKSMINDIDDEKLNCFERAIDIMRTAYIELLENRFYTGNNITVIHGDLNPSRINISRVNGQVKFDGLQAVRIGIPTEDLAMLFALHIAPNKEKVLPYLNNYYQILSKQITNYSYQTFMSDYKLSIMENMFFVIKLMNQGIYDFAMRDKAIEAFRTFVDVS
ncbi:MAG: helix-turn-helix transcriptional regulator [Clostridia bacterium]|nr:helix-turn-helix transcriptional regulator [Clostridia bacterium]